MSVKPSLKVVLCWHMHQPQYHNLLGGAYQLPWTYLHAIKDYADMAAHLEAQPHARAVVNFAPVLLEQITDYAQQVKDFCEGRGTINDPLLAALGDAVLPEHSEDRLALMRACLRANQSTMIDRFPVFQQLVELARVFAQHPASVQYLQDEFLADLLMWYHLAWLGESVRRQDSQVQALISKAHGFSLHDRRQLLLIIGELLSGVIGRYAALAKSGQIELAVSPYNHPILPLLLDLQSAHEAMPGAPLPAVKAYPGGDMRAHWHLQHAVDCFSEYFGVAPSGCWPSEGSISSATLRLLDEFGFRWAASGESVLRNSLAHEAVTLPASDGAPLYRPYRLKKGKVACFFRDDGLSDLIGFTYSSWHADDAVANLIHHLENIAVACQDSPDSVVSIILDGENAWEYYPENGYYFLEALYRELADHPHIELTTFSACLEDGTTAGELNHVVAGSWVYGTFSTWIGETDKNRGWDMLADAKHAFDAALAAGLAGEKRIRAERQLAICEGSDWFWWFGGDNPIATVSDFDHLYRSHLSALYQILGSEPPEYLAHAFSHGGGEPAHGGTMRPGRQTA